MTLIINHQEGQCHCGCMIPLKNSKRQFLQGHDAKLKSTLIDAMVADDLVTIDWGVGSVTQTPEDVARGFSSELWDHVQKAVERRRYKALIKRQKSIDRGEKKIAAAGGSPEPMRAKVGRWIYDGFVLREGLFTYVNKQGTTVSTSKYQVVES